MTGFGKRIPSLHLRYWGIWGSSLLALLMQTSPAQAANLDINLLTVVDGTPSFDSIAGPGNDTNNSNGIVRTNDTISYGYNFSINGQFPVNNVTIVTDPLPVGAHWEALPPQCSGLGSSISADGRTLTCNRGTYTQTVSENITLTARVGSSIQNGTVFPMKVQLSASNSTSQISESTNATVSAQPRYDLRKTEARVLSRVGSDGTTPGILILYSIGILADSSNGGKGVEALSAAPITFQDIVSGISSSARLYTWGSSTDPACAPNRSTNTSDFYLPAIPRGKIGSNGGTVANAVVDSGTISCTQSGPGQNINISIAGANTSGSSYPTNTANGNTLPVNEAYVISGQIAIWIPRSSISGSVNTTNTFTAMDPTGISGQSNYGTGTETTTNNSRAVNLVVAGGTFAKAYIDIDRGRLPTQSGPKSGDGVVTPGQDYLARIGVNNTGIDPLSNVILCDKVDKTTNIVTGFSLGRDATNDEIIPTTDYVVEYATSANTPNQRQATCNTAGDGPWTVLPTTISSAIGAQITKVRVRMLTPVSALVNYQFFIKMQALENVDGTLLVNYMSGQSNGGTWSHANQTITATSAVPGLGDRLFLTHAIARITKTASPSNVLAGSNTTFTLSSTINSAKNIPASVTIVDTIPPELTYVYNSANVVPSTVVVNTALNVPNPGPVGQTTLTWNFPTVIANSPLPTITFQSRAKTTTSDNTTVTNQVVIASPQDSASPVSQRTAFAGVLISNVAAFTVDQTTATPYIELGQPLNYNLSYANLSTNIDINFTDIISVLPYNGDTTRPAPEPGRTPGSNFNGTITLAWVPTVPSGTTVYYTKAPINTVNSDPKSISNQAALPNPNGSGTNWCLASQFGTGNCPANFSEVTAFRAKGGELPPLSGLQTIQVTLNSNANQGDDLYTSGFGAEAGGLPNRVYSNTPPIKVIAGTLIGRVFNDLNDNANQDGAELGIGGVTVSLTGIDAFNRPVNLTTKSVAATNPPNALYPGSPAIAGPIAANALYPGSPALSIGNYFFRELASVNGAGYTLTETQPVGYVDGKDTVGSLGGTLANDSVSTIPLTNNVVTGVSASGTGYLFGEMTQTGNLSLVKRLTAVNGTAITSITNDGISNSADDQVAWPTNYLQGAINASGVQPGDILEYTIYFLSSGNGAIAGVNLCDRIPTNTTYVTNSGRLRLGALPVNTLTDGRDSDAGEYIAAGVAVAHSVIPGIGICRSDRMVGQDLTSAENPNGAEWVQLNPLSSTLNPGQYGYLRFQVKVNQ